jgi:hypothetical protein
MFDHVRHVQRWMTMAYHVYDPIYYKVMTNVVYDIQFQDIEASCMMWRKLNVVINDKGMGTLMFKGFMADIVQVKWNVVSIIHGTKDPIVKMVDKEYTCLFLWT